MSWQFSKPQKSNIYKKLQNSVEFFLRGRTNILESWANLRNIASSWSSKHLLFLKRNIVLFRTGELKQEKQNQTDKTHYTSWNQFNSYLWPKIFKWKVPFGNILVVIKSLTQKLIYSASLGLCGSAHRVLIQTPTLSTSNQLETLRQNTKERTYCKTLGRRRWNRF